MTALVVYLVLVVVGVYAAVRAFDWFTRPSGLPRWRRPPMTANVPLERLVDDLRRLDREYRRIQRSDLPARAARLRSVTLAYDDTLCACCLALDLPEPTRPPLGPVARLETEAALAQRGLTW